MFHTCSHPRVFWWHAPQRLHQIQIWELVQAHEGFQYLQMHLLPAREESHKSAHSRCLRLKAASTLIIACVCVDCTILPRSCRWPSCSVPLLCRETRPPTPPAIPGGGSPPGSGLPEAGQEGRSVWKAVIVTDVLKLSSEGLLCPNQTNLREK